LFISAQSKVDSTDGAGRRSSTNSAIRNVTDKTTSSICKVVSSRTNCASVCIKTVNTISDV